MLNANHTILQLVISNEIVYFYIVQIMIQVTVEGLDILALLRDFDGSRLKYI